MKILVIRFSSIGDIVLASPLFRCLKRQLPGVEVHLLTKASFRAVTEANPYIDRFHLYDGSLAEVLRSLRRERFDAVLDVQRNIRSGIVCALLRRRTCRMRKLALGKFLLTRFHIDRMPDRHISLRTLDTAAPLGIRDDGEGLEYHIPPGVSPPEGLLSSGMRGRYTALCIGASYATKKLPVERLTELCRILEGPIVLVGGPEDGPAGSAIARALPDRVVDACGRCSLHQSAAIVREARVVISHDTGMQYIAAAFQRPVIALWGGTSPELRVEPFYGTSREPLHHNMRVPGLPCQPCSNYGKKKCPEGHFDCMMRLDLHSIAALANAAG